jgi:hypothetical protein
MMGKFTNFAKILVEDVVASQHRLGEADTPSNRRDTIRATFSAIEGVHWMLKTSVLEDTVNLLTIHEIAAMSEETYSVSDSGKVESLPRFIPLTASIRLLVAALQKLKPDYQVDFQHSGWAALKQAVRVRNRLVHPKTIKDLEVSDADLGAAVRGFNWMLALAVEGLHETVKDRRAKLPTVAIQQTNSKPSRD